jgi:hypothetical protein
VRNGGVRYVRDDLVRKLEPPPEPVLTYSTRRDALASACAIFLGTASIVLILAHLAHGGDHRQMRVFILVVSLLALCLGLALASRIRPRREAAREQYAIDRDRWLQDIGEWEQTYYCGSCSNVFIRLGETV